MRFKTLADLFLKSYMTGTALFLCCQVAQGVQTFVMLTALFAIFFAAKAREEKNSPDFYKAVRNVLPVLFGSFIGFVTAFFVFNRFEMETRQLSAMLGVLLVPIVLPAFGWLFFEAFSFLRKTASAGNARKHFLYLFLFVFAFASAICCFCWASLEMKFRCMMIFAVADLIPSCFDSDGSLANEHASTAIDDKKSVTP